MGRVGLEWVVSGWGMGAHRAFVAGADDAVGGCSRPELLPKEHPGFEQDKRIRMQEEDARENSTCEICSSKKIQASERGFRLRIRSRTATAAQRCAEIHVKANVE